jgi:hypothetical protein
MTIMIWLYFNLKSYFFGFFCLLCCTASEVTVYEEKSSTYVSFKYLSCSSNRTFFRGFFCHCKFREKRTVPAKLDCDCKCADQSSKDISVSNVFIILVGYTHMIIQTTRSSDLRDIDASAKCDKIAISRSGRGRTWREPNRRRIPDRLASRRALRTRPRPSHYRRLLRICGLGL